MFKKAIILKVLNQQLGLQISFYVRMKLDKCKTDCRSMTQCTYIDFTSWRFCFYLLTDSTLVRWGQVSWLCSLPSFSSFPSLLSGKAEMGKEKALVLCKHCSVTAKTLTSSQHWFSRKSKTQHLWPAMTRNAGACAIQQHRKNSSAWALCWPRHVATAVIKVFPGTAEEDDKCYSKQWKSRTTTNNQQTLNIQ